jgi:hypothetical protein
MRLAARFILVAFIAALCAGIPMATILTTGMPENLKLVAGPRLLLLAASGSFFIGLPVAIVTFLSMRNDHGLTIEKLLRLANVAAMALTVLVSVFAGAVGFVLIGLPIFVAANSFAIAEWFIIIKPERRRA